MLAAFDCEGVLRFLSWTAAAVLSAASLGAHAVPQAADLHGVVSDSAGAPVAGAVVTVSRGNTVIAEKTTDDHGAFTFLAPSREYRVTVKSPGYNEIHSPAMPFAARSVRRFTLLRPGEVGLAVSPVRGATSQLDWEYGGLFQGGLGTGDRSAYKFLQAGVHAGKILTPNLGSGLLQGNFEYAVEVFPFWQSYTPQKQKVSCTADPPAAVGSYTCSQPYTVGGTYTGVSVTPIMLRWNLSHGKRVMPWLQGAGGVVWTNHKYPAIGNTNTLDTASNGPHGDSSVWNFTPQFGVGLHYFLKPRRSLDFSANAVHLSSASLGDKNPGVNASVQFSVGYTWWK